MALAVVVVATVVAVPLGDLDLGHATTAMAMAAPSTTTPGNADEDFSHGTKLLITPEVSGRPPSEVRSL